ncbi:MAG: M48 family metallopeptidase [Candidatus Woesearchaeota archaeon]
MATTNFYKEVSSNKTRSFMLLVMFSALLLVMGYFLGYIFGAPIFGIIIAFAVAVIMSLIGFYSGQNAVLSLNGAKPIEKKDDIFYYNTVEGLCIAAGLPMPKLYMIQEESINAFASGRDPKHAVVCVTSGCRKRLNRQEFEGVIAHELSHVKNYDIRVMMLAAILAGSVVILADIMLRSFLFGGGRRSGGKDSGGLGIVLILVAIALAILAPIFAQMIKLAVSRKREYLADATGAQLTRYPAGLSSALKKIRDDHDKVVDTANRATAHLYIENPLRNSKAFMSGLFSTHPPIDERIKRLEGM